jgi:hypothetical protein
LKQLLNSNYVQGSMSHLNQLGSDIGDAFTDTARQGLQAHQDFLAGINPHTGEASQTPYDRADTLSHFLAGNLFPTVAPAGALGAGPVLRSTPALDMSQAARMQRAADMGFDTDRTWYHGTTHDFPSFDIAKTNPENHLGQGAYFTSSPADASANYAGRGPDLTNRIEQLAERMMSDGPEHQWGSTDYANAYSDAIDKAASQLHGPHEGAVIPAHLKMANPINLTKDNPTWLDFHPEYDQEGEFIDDSPMMKKLADAFDRAGAKYNFNGRDALGDVAEKANLYDGDVKATDLDKALRSNDTISYAEDPNSGALASHQIISDIYKGLGHDGIVMDASDAFPNMKLPEGTQHAIVFDPSSIRSPFAKFDPSKAGSGDILAGVGAGAAGLGLGSLDDRQ